MKKTAVFFLFIIVTAPYVRADVLFEDSSNYPYANGCIEGQGQWYCYLPTPPHLNAFVTNNVLLLTANPTNDAVAAPTNGWANLSGTITYASFSINVSQLPASPDGGYFCQFQNTNDTNDCCHVFIDARDTVVPGTYRLGIANFATSFSVISPPVNFPMDLSPGITYNVVIVYDTDVNSPTVGATLMINPSFQDYQNFIQDAEQLTDTYFGQSYVFPMDTTGSQDLLNIVISEIGFSPYANAGISNIIAGTVFIDVNSTNPPVIGIQPQPGTNYSGNSTALYTAASGVDLTYQWYSSTGGALSDGVNFTGSTSNVLTLNNLSASDNYHVVITDAYGNTALSSTASETVITTPTAPFFPPSSPGQASAPGINLTNNLFTSFALTNIALGTGPLTYQWYFAPTNTPTTFAPLGGQTMSSLSIPELEYPNAGNYYVLASNSAGTTAGPTNNLAIVPPVVATLPQLHTLMGLVVTNITPSSVVPINTNGISVSGYVSTFGPLTKSTSTFSEFYITYSNYGIYVFFSPSGHTNAVPAPGTYVTVTGPCQVYHGQLEIDPITNGVVISSNTPIQIPAPQPGDFAQLATNALGAYGLQVQCSLMTFTNVYLYGTKTGGAYTGNGGAFFSNSFTTLYMTQGPYSSPNNTNYIQVFVAAYGFGSISTNFWGKFAPNYAYQLTGIMANFSGASELDPTRLDDFVTNTPPSFPASLSQTGEVPTISWPAQVGSTYSVYSAANVNGPWINQASGLSYYPSTGTYADINHALAKFYRISTP
jgi:hypothetical protein